MKPIGILGCGPAGLMAAHACAMAGRPFLILSRPEQSKLGGAQFLHVPIPGINDPTPDAILTYRIMGDAATYRQKVYGDNPFVPFASMEFIEDYKEQDAWNLQATYDKLWSLYSSGINPIELTFDWASRNMCDFSKIISAVPRQSLCNIWAAHRFVSQRVRIHNQAIESIEDNTIVYNGYTDNSWYRMSRIFSVGSTEYPVGIDPPVSSLVDVVKPIVTNCDCLNSKMVLFVGRYGRYEKGILSHDGFTRTQNALALQ